MYVDGEEVGRSEYDHSDFNWAKLVCLGHSADISESPLVGKLTD
jgi:hypothetical protein